MIAEALPALASSLELRVSNVRYASFSFSANNRTLLPYMAP
jgi:hypothetical protein